MTKYAFNSIYGLTHFIKHYGVGMSANECEFSDGIVKLRGKEIATFAFYEDSGVPVFNFRDPFCNKLQRENYYEALEAWIGFPKVSNSEYLKEVSKEAKLVFVGSFEYHLPFSHNQNEVDVYLDKERRYLHIVNADGSGYVWKSFWRPPEMKVEQEVMKMVWAILGK